MITSHLEVGFKIAGSAGVYVSPYKATGFEGGQEAGRGCAASFLPKDTTVFKDLHTWLMGSIRY